MKSVVVEIQDKHAVLLNAEGNFIRVKNKNYTIGQRVENKTAKTKPVWAKWAVAAAAAAVIMFGGGAYAYYTPYTDVSFDINPSLELSTNIFDTVIGVKAMNGDATQLLSKIQIKDCDLQTALTRLVDELVNEGYLTVDEDAAIMLTTFSTDQNHAKTMLMDMKKTLEREMDRLQVHSDIQGECIGGELKIRAQELGVSPGKLMLVERYAQSAKDPATVNAEEWLNKPVKDLMAAIIANREQKNGNIPANGAQSQQGYTGGELSGNGYNGGLQSSNGDNAGMTDQNGYTGGDKNNNGYNGGEAINNDRNPAPKNTDNSSEAPSPAEESSSPSRNNGSNPSGECNSPSVSPGMNQGNGNGTKK